MPACRFLFDVTEAPAIGPDAAKNKSHRPVREAKNKPGGIPMQALVIDRLGGPEVYRLAEMPVPEPGRGQVQIRVEGAGPEPCRLEDPERGCIT